MTTQQAHPDKLVRQFRQIVLWPLQLMPIRGEGTQIQRHWEVLEKPGPDNAWHEVVDEFTGDPEEFQERHYNEFVDVPAARAAIPLWRRTQPARRQSRPPGSMRFADARVPPRRRRGRAH